MSTSNSSIAILVIFYNKLSQTITCIESFLYSSQNIYVLNNASDKNSWEYLKAYFEKHKNVILFNSDINLGPAGGRNFLIEKSTEDWIFIVDNDVFVKPEKYWKNIFHQKISEIKDGLMFSPKIFNVHENSYATSHTFVNTNGVLLLEESNFEVTNYFSCCGIIINRKIFDLYGLFESNLFAFEDYEFSIRAMCSTHGEFKVYPIPEIELVHDHQIQKGRNDKKAVLQRYNEDKISKSLKLISSKHNILFSHDWQWWTRKQVSDMKGHTFFTKVLYKIRGFINKL